MYADYKEPAAKIPSHRMLAIRRGAKEEVLTFEIELDRSVPLTYLRNKILKAEGEWIPHLEEAIEDSYDRLLNPSIQTEVRLELKDRSDEEAIRVFKDNLENLLLSPPAGALNVIALDPGLRTGCKVAVIDDTGKFLEHSVIYPLEPKNDIVGSATTLAAAHRQIQRPGHRHRQWHRVARDRRLRAGFPASRPDCANVQCRRE